VTVSLFSHYISRTLICTRTVNSSSSGIDLDVLRCELQLGNIVMKYPHGADCPLKISANALTGTLFFPRSRDCVKITSMPPSFFPNTLPPFNIDTSLGALEIGTLVATTLFGATCIQVYLYFEKYPKDHKLIKALVGAVWILELGHTIAICHAVYTMTITWYAQPQLLDVPPLSLDISVLINGFIGPLEQAWFTRRLYVFSRNLWLTAICCALSFGRLVASIAYAGTTFTRLEIFAFQLKYWPILTCIVVLGSANDVLLASSLAWYLYKHKLKNISKVGKLLDRLIIWAVETSSITTVATLAMMICFFAMPVNFIYIGIYVCLAKIYANALLASLNARESFSQRLGEVISLQDMSSSMGTRPLSNLTPPISSYQHRSQFSDEMQLTPLSQITSSASTGDVYDRFSDLNKESDIISRKYPVTSVTVERQIVMSSSR
jgi:hypothetical protein